MGEAVHQLDLTQHGLAGLAVLVHLQHHHLTSGPVLHLESGEGGREGVKNVCLELPSNPNKLHQGRCEIPQRGREAHSYSPNISRNT